MPAIMSNRKYINVKNAARVSNFLKVGILAVACFSGFRFIRYTYFHVFMDLSNYRLSAQLSAVPAAGKTNVCRVGAHIGLDCLLHNACYELDQTLAARARSRSAPPRSGSSMRRASDLAVSVM